MPGGCKAQEGEGLALSTPTSSGIMGSTSLSKTCSISKPGPAEPWEKPRRGDVGGFLGIKAEPLEHKLPTPGGPWAQVSTPAWLKSMLLIRLSSTNLFDQWDFNESFHK